MSTEQPLTTDKPKRTPPTPLTPEEREKRFIDKLNDITKKNKAQTEFVTLHALRIAGNDYDAVYYNALKKLIQAEFRANDAKIEAAKIITKKDDAQAKTWLAQKERTHLLCDLGGLVVKAGLDQIDREVLAGMVAAWKGAYDSTVKELDVPDKAAAAQQKIDNWKSKGKTFLN